jgi:hypothetical protein
MADISQQWRAAQVELMTQYTQTANRIRALVRLEKLDYYEIINGDQDDLPFLDATFKHWVDMIRRSICITQVQSSQLCAQLLSAYKSLQVSFSEAPSEHSLQALVDWHMSTLKTIEDSATLLAKVLSQSCRTSKVQYWVDKLNMGKGDVYSLSPSGITSRRVLSFSSYEGYCFDRQARLYLTGGFSNRVVTSTVRCFHLQGDMAEVRLAGMKDGRHLHGSAFYRGCVYAIAGKDSSRSPIPACERYFVDSDTWEALPSLPEGATPDFALGLEDSLYALSTEVSLRGAIYQLSLETLSWNCIVVSFPLRSSRVQYFSTTQLYFFLQGAVYVLSDAHVQKVSDTRCPAAACVLYSSGQLLCVDDNDFRRLYVEDLAL